MTATEAEAGTEGNGGREEIRARLDQDLEAFAAGEDAPSVQNAVGQYGGGEVGGGDRTSPNPRVDVVLRRTVVVRGVGEGRGWECPASEEPAGVGRRIGRVPPGEGLIGFLGLGVDCTSGCTVFPLIISTTTVF
jgi:hypothetical protein